ncbi:MAG: xanthine dehydrogenase family protein subunit M [Rhodospirillaceae bacterium]|nr:xanthine dehydrogenase family protein subunit M [Rhodospirillaceae bacterium]MCY4065985.1 xanthine dehydrogenase family protein subunit M [Rhodospirillaceae bacterium]
MSVYLRPDNLEEALDALQRRPLTVLAGGTDYYPGRVGRPLDDDLLDLTGIATLRGIADEGDRWRIGALATWTDLVRADLPACFDGLKDAAREVGGVQIQNAGTIAGNLCNASPAADGAPNLAALEAEVELSAADGVRRLPVTEFLTGNRTTALGPGEIVTAVLVPKLPDNAASAFLKLGARRYLVISIVMIGIVLVPDGGTVSDARIAVGACSPVTRRLPALEAVLKGKPLDTGLGEAVSAEAVETVLSPIDDVRGSAGYRLDATVTMLRRGLSEMGRRMGAGA